MPNYSNAPPADQNGISLPIFRTPPSGKMRAVITSEDLIGTNTHFWGGHTVPCTAPECEPCRNGVPYRWHAYLTALSPKKALHFLYETTAAAAEILVAHRNKKDRLRGTIFEAYRWRSSPNGRVMLRCEDQFNDEMPLPPPPNLEAVLAVLWQLPKHNVTPTDSRFLGAEIAVDLTVPGQTTPPNPGT